MEQTALEVVESPSLEVFKRHTDVVLKYMVWWWMQQSERTFPT